MDTANDDVKALLESGKKSGYITRGQFNQINPAFRTGEESFDELMDHIQNRKIRMIDESDVTYRSLISRLNHARGHLASIRQCQETPEPQRHSRTSSLRAECGWVYLTNHADKFQHIGKTDRNYRKRIREHLKKYRSFVLEAKYATVVSHKLEKAIHRHFTHRRVKQKGERKKGARQNQPGEKFELSPDERDAFRETVTAIEAWVLRSEQARLELEILRLETAIKGI